MVTCPTSPIQICQKNKPQILILDEATSHLDPAREQHISAAIGSLAITRIIIAHRAETIAQADRICLLTNGRSELFDREAFLCFTLSSAEARTADPGTSNKDGQNA